MKEAPAALSPEEMARFKREAEASGQTLAAALFAAGKISENAYLADCAERLGLPFEPELFALAFGESGTWRPDEDIIRGLPLAWSRRATVAAMRSPKGELILAVSRPEDARRAREIELQCGMRPRSCILAPAAAIVAIIDRIFGESEGESVASLLEGEEAEDIGEDAAEDLLDESGDAPFIKTVNTIIAQALRAGASDIHIEPYRDVSRVRFRLDGVLYDRHVIQKAHHPAVVSRVKVMAKLDIAEKRLPQDGRIAIVLGGREAGLRVSTLPTSFGERVVLRLLEKNERVLSLRELGLASEDYESVKRLITEPHGVVLVTGPTGSGKTTTLYAVLRDIASPEKNILTIEDPVEYELEGVGQMQVNPKIDLTFADGLRAIVRQDPDVILIGEIRDGETASIAVQSALTGHLVFSTLHTNDAPSAVTRLFDMGVEPFLLSSVLRGVVAQRLVRVLCPRCAREIKPPTGLLMKLRAAGLDKNARVREPVGCEGCMDTGYRGRMAIYEIMPVGDKMKNLIVSRADANELRARALSDGMLSLENDGLRKVALGLTSFAEVERVARG